MMENLSKVASTIRENDNFLITSHINPDGDAAGSMSAMGHLLNSLGKKFSIFSPDPVPEKFQWVNWPCPVRSSISPDVYSWGIVVDCGDLERTGHAFLKRNTLPLINIDHHMGNPAFGEVNWIDTRASSVGEMVARLADHLDVELAGPMAEGIYLALVSDTGFFSFGNTSAQALELSARLLRNGLKPGEINPKILNQWTIGRLHLHGTAMKDAEFFLNGKVGIISVTRGLLDKTGTTPDDCEGLVNTVRNIKSVVVAVSIREEDDQGIKFSLRSTGDVNVQAMAAEMGGGGHKNASGGVLNSDLAQAKKKLLEVISSHLQ